jgi:arylsulfatase A-like enzyme
MPRLAAFAKDAVVFERAIAPSSWTLPSVATVMTGLAPAVHGAGRRVRVRSGASYDEFLEYNAVEQSFVRFNRGEIYRFSALRSNVDTLAEVLGRHYLTHAVNSNLNLSHLGNVLTQGFDSVVYESTLAGEAVTRRALEWLAENADAQVFVYAHYMEPHEWRDALKDRKDLWRSQGHPVYVQLVRRVDAAVGELMRGLRELGLYEDALVVFFSDHGEHFWDDASGTIFGHGNTLDRHAVDVPLIVKFPGGALAGRRVVEPVKLADIFATVLAEVELNATGGGRFDLRSLRTAAESSGPPEPRTIVSEFTIKRDDLLAVWRGEFKAIANLTLGGWSLRRAASDAPVDASQGEAARALAELREAARAHRETALRWSAPPQPIEVTADEAEQLRELGYMR